MSVLDRNNTRVDRPASISLEMQRVVSTLRWRRVYLGLTGVQVATKMGIKRQNLYEMEAGRRLPKGGTLLRWMQALEMRLELVPFEGKAPVSSLRLNRNEQRAAQAGLRSPNDWKYSKRKRALPALSPQPTTFSCASIAPSGE